MSNALRFGLIGCGSQGRYLSEAASITGQAELCACADVNPEAAQRAVALNGYAKAYDDYREMLAAERLAAVIVATTHDQLQPVAMAAVEAGVHALVEKPMALTAADGRALVEAARARGVKIAVGYTLRFMPERVHMKKLLEEGAVGDLAHVFAGQLIGGMGGWLGDRARGGGPLFYIGTHVLDQVLWVVGSRAERVFAEVNRVAQATSPADAVEADASVTIRFEGGVVAQVCCSQRMGGRYGWLDVVGSAGRVRAEWESNCLYVESHRPGAPPYPATIEVPADAYHPAYSPEATARLTGFRYIRAWAAELTDFVGAIREDRDPRASGEDGLQVLEITDAVFESERTGAPVALLPH
jgi:predicted dehydrogenase